MTDRGGDSAPSSFVLGVDGGGTRTRAVIIDRQGLELGRGDFAGAVVTASQPARAADAVTEAVRRAAERAMVVLPADAMWAGLAGAGNEAARTAVHDALVDRGLAHRLVVGTDVEAAFHDAFGSGPGVLLIAGTGSIVWARSDVGEVHRVGGWGRHLGDEGSGFALGMRALRHIARAEDGRCAPTELRKSILSALEMDAVEGLVAWVERASKAEVASLAPLIVEVADRGDAGALAIVEHAVEALRTQVAASVRRLWGSAVDGGVPEVVLWGGLLAGEGPLRQRVEEDLAVIGVTVGTRSVDPPMGAARLALADRTD